MIFPFNFLQFWEKSKKIFSQNHITTSIDYHRFSIKNYELLWNLLGRFLKANIDDDNSNSYTSMNWEYTIEKRRTNLWYAYVYLYKIDWIGTYSLFSIEEFNYQTMRLTWSSWRIEFTGVYFHFEYDLPIDVQNLYFDLYENSLIEYSWVVSTRVDVAVDCAVEVPFMMAFVKKHKNSKKALRCYNWVFDESTERMIKKEQDWYKHWNFQSYAYLPTKWKGYGIRVYNKHLDIAEKWKISWYAWSDLPENWTRFEFVFMGNYCQQANIQKLIHQSHWALFWKPVSWDFKYKPKAEYSLELTYRNLEKYLCQ